MNETPFIEARWYGSRSGTLIDLVVLHSTEGDLSKDGAENTAKYFQRIERKASTQAVVDRDSIVFCVRAADAAYGAAGVNFRAYHIEQAAKAAWTREDWLDAEGRPTVHNAAVVSAAVILDHPNIKLEWRTAADMLAGRFDGITSHAEVEKYHHSTGHTDPGPNFPIDVFLSDLRALLGEDDMTPDEVRVIVADEIRKALNGASEIRTRVDALSSKVGASDSNNQARYADLKATVESHSGGSSATPAQNADELARRLAT